MRHLTRRQALGLAIIIALIAAGLVYVVLQAKTEPPTELAGEVTVLVADEDIDAYETITSDMVTTETVDQAAAPAGVLSSPAEAIGRIAGTPIRQGDHITRRMVETRSPEAGLTFAIEPGMRAVTVALDPVSGVGGFVLPGDHVDVLATFERDNVGMTRTILQDVEVLAIGEQTTRPRSRVEQQTDEDAEEDAQAPATEQVKNATLAVDPEQAQSLILAAYRGSLHLILRPPEDESYVALAGQTDWQLMGLQEPAPAKEPEKPAPPEERYVGMGYPPMTWQQGPQPAAEPEPAQPTVEIIRGTEREVISTQ
ncbi:MAG: Flp pilus assembly protein CpaB [Armatimonadota bacterium]